MAQNPISPQDLLVAIRQLENVANRTATKNLDFHKRRITNAGDSVDAGDYITQGEVTKVATVLSLLIKSIEVTLDRAFSFNKQGDVSFNRQSFTIGSARVQVITGEGDPEGVVSAFVGSLYLRSDGIPNFTLYVKENGADNTGWVAK